MIHLHGTPITPRAVLAQLAGRNFCISYAAPGDVTVCHEIGQMCMLDNGAFTLWQKQREGKPIPARLVAATNGDWSGFFDWVEPWLDYQTTWAVIPDVIDGTEADNDLLLAKWFQRRLPRGAPVWHMHESLDRLQRLCVGYPRVCIGSSAQYADVGSPSWHRRMDQAMNRICGNGPAPVWLHMLRGMGMSGCEYPFASVDSTDVAQNHNRPWNTAPGMVERWDAKQCPARWTEREQLELVA